MTLPQTIPDLIPFEDAGATRQDKRMEKIPDLYLQKHERLAVELALHIEDADSIFATYGYTPEQAADLLESPAFLAIMQRAAKEIQTSGLSFKTKAQLIAGELLPYAHDLATDPMVSAATRLASVQWVAKMAGFEPKEKGEEGKTGGGLTLSITFAGQAPQQVVSARETLTIENGGE